MAQSNEPQFQQALTDKNAAAQHADTAPGEYRAHEAGVVDQTKDAAQAQAASGLAGMHASKGAALASLVADKGATKSKDEAKRTEVTTKIQGIFDATEADVRKTLDGLDPQVDAAFEKGEAAAKAAFEAYVAGKMSAYKADRYSGWLGGLRWAKDKLLGMPDAVNEFYTAGRELYLQRMDGVISGVADLVGSGLQAAKARIARGRAEIATYVKSLPTDLRKVGAEASTEIGERFGALEKDVDSKQDALVDSLASKYVEARKGLDERIEALQAENKGLVDKAIGAIKGVIDTIRGLVSMLTTVLARAASVIGDIIKDPIGFLGNLVAGVKGGIDKFFGNIEKHLREGLMGWLFGALAEGGVELPETLDIKGILKLVASIFGLTWANIRTRIVKQIGEKAMAAVEKGVEIFQVIATQGIGGLWDMLVAKLGDIKEMILEKVRDFVITKIITAGITWLISLLNPAAAFIKACKMIYDVIMFFVNNGERIMAFVNTVIDSVAEIVKGNVSGVVDKIEDVLGKMVPILIGFLASALGLGGIGEKIREIVDTLRKPVNLALDFVIKQGLRLAGPVIRLAQGVVGKAKAGIAAGKAYVKGKVDAGKAYVKGKIAATAAAVRRSGRAPATPEEDIADRWTRGMAAIAAISQRSRSGGMGTEQLHHALASVRTTYRFQEIRATRQHDGWGVYAKLNPDNADRLVPISGKTLLVGEGNLTFAAANVRLGVVLPGDLTATVYEPKQAKSAATQARGQQLAEQGVTVEYGVDATGLHVGAEQLPKYDTITWMFPHPGGPRGEVAVRGAALLSAFFASAKQRLHPGGKITVTLRKAKRDWYVSRWKPEQLAIAAGLRLVAQRDFVEGDYPGYGHETTDKGASQADVSNGHTFVFMV